MGRSRRGERRRNTCASLGRRIGARRRVAAASPRAPGSWPRHALSAAARRPGRLRERDGARVDAPRGWRACAHAVSTPGQGPPERPSETARAPPNKARGRARNSPRGGGWGPRPRAERVSSKPPGRSAGSPCWRAQPAPACEPPSAPSGPLPPAVGPAPRASQPRTPPAQDVGRQVRAASAAAKMAARAGEGPKTGRRRCCRRWTGRGRPPAHPRVFIISRRACEVVAPRRIFARAAPGRGESRRARRGLERLVYGGSPGGPAPEPVCGRCARPGARGGSRGTARSPRATPVFACHAPALAANVYSAVREARVGSVPLFRRKRPDCGGDADARMQSRFSGGINEIKL